MDDGKADYAGLYSAEVYIRTYMTLVHLHNEAATPFEIAQIATGVDWLRMRS
jgi:hypothetical protein